MKDCVSLDLARKLRDAGWEQVNTHHAWVWDELPQGGYAGVSDKTEPPEMAWMIQSPMCPDEFKSESVFAAPIISELLDALPHPHDRTGHKNLKLYRADDETYEAYYSDIGGETWENCIASSPNPADALASLWLALREKKII